MIGPLPNVNTHATSVSEWLRQRRRLRAQDSRSARLAELYGIQAVIHDAERIVLGGWTQHTWYAAVDRSGAGETPLAPPCCQPQPLAIDGAAPFDRACLVGAIVYAAGGPAAVRSQLTARTLRLTWHTLFRPGRPIVAWCSPPDRRAAEVRDLTQWNDTPSREAAEVVALLRATRAAAAAEATAVRGKDIAA
jgi:hypothetical protein